MTTSSAQTAGSTVQFVDLRRTFGDTKALDGLNLTIEPGELLALLGPSGCGKTTALRTIAGFDQADSGQVLMDGTDIGRTPAHRRGVGMVFQSYSLFPHLSAADNVAFGLRMRGVGSATRRAKAVELLELVGLPRHADRFPRQLSGGQQQRIALARALALQPKVLLLDEPLSALDAQVRQNLRDEIRRLQRQLGITTLMVTHDQEEAFAMADRVAVMRAGSLEQCAAPAELYQRPATAFVAEFVGTMSRIPGLLEPDGSAVQVQGRTVPVHGTLAVPGSGDVDVLVRPEDVGVMSDADSPARIVQATFLGANTRLIVELPEGTQVVADTAAPSSRYLAVGTPVTLTLPDGPVMVDRPIRDSGKAA
ncbi:MULTISPECIES: ABC transporter ATP-binding protein [unclassified Mycolicibacterium]|nr:MULTISPECIES: ABC transporter ATP-binding protein [unclassified Mycolicibacterium]MUM30139.1 ABC transporter ATP-binding protein [Mycolicibacterium sp. CBMA 295]MUL81138.1 ABC transporter ATP-binding protein [Mycolicibacterium sp. CBMA 329]MUL86904.1 ABC transporter ATP-binding protein [Mycolicibacterium sp. CBMA 331]MUL98812.1 ABC transporter ATP-binding protein [Mycolicibacterium sp. CBMA 334]MUM37201.1 ABC transporter ATP-binding protein [Mycolicibacterium sp. CBMA 247]